MTSLLSAIQSPQDLKKLPLEKLQAVADEIRAEILRVVLHNGGHLGSNLGVVELTVALHYVYDFIEDRLVFDVSHQTYTHKILTGRRERFDSLRQYKGVTGFGSKEESPYDPFTFAHAGTGTSTALGLAVGDLFSNRHRRVVAMVGDGSMTCGVAFEALNHAGHLKKSFLVVLNDNKMSIAKTVGALSTYLHKVRMIPLYTDLKNEAHNILTKLPLVGGTAEKALDMVREAMKATLGGYLFEQLGFHYYGPVDGHDIPKLVETLHDVRRIEGPVLLHVITEKGRGRVGNDKDPFAFHAAPPAPAPESCMVPGQATQKISMKPTWTKTFAKHLIDLAHKDKRIIALTAAMPDGTGVLEFQKAFPDRAFDVGICEQHGVAFAAGMAAAGMRPFAAIYSTFLQRAYDMIFHEVCLQNLPVVFCMDRGGLAGADGPTHHGVADIAYMRVFPRMVLMSPKDGEELRLMLEYAASMNGPCGIRYPRANIPDREEVPHAPIELGKAEVLREGKDGALVGYGHMVYPCLEVAEILAKEGIDLTVVNGRFAKPVDVELFTRLLAEQPLVMTVEDHNLAGGFGSAVLEAAQAAGAEVSKIVRLGLPDRYIEHGSREQLLADLGLDVAGIARSVRQLMESPTRDLAKG